MQENYWRLIWCICICYMHSHSLGFKGYRETKRIILVIPREPGWYQEKVLKCCTLFFTSLFAFYDVVHFSRLCKSWSFFDWSFNLLQRPWSWLRSRLIILGFRGLNKLQFPLMVFPFSQRFPVIYSIKFAFHFKKVSILPIKVFLVRWGLFDLFKKPCCREISTIWKLAYEITPQTMNFLVRHGLAIDSRKHGSQSRSIMDFKHRLAVVYWDNV